MSTLVRNYLSYSFVNVKQYDVIIIGAGPTGLMAANQLARYDIDLLIIDSKAGPTDQSRAIVITARSMEIYQQMGISGTAIEEGRFITDFAIFSAGKEKATAHVGEFGKGQTDFSYLLAFEQSKNEKLLVKNLGRYNKEVCWNTELINIVQQTGSVEVDLKNVSQPGAATEKISAKYIIGCDGASSVVRHLFNFSFKGGTYEKQFYVVDTKLKWAEGFNKLILCPSRKNFCGFFPMAGSNTHRIIGTVPKELNDGREIVFDDLEKTIKKTVGFPMEIEKVNWFSVYKLHHRSVDTFSKGNIFLAGDAAHIHSPAGGQGMNTGLQDAYNLSWKLALVIKKIAGEKILTTYNEERLPFAQWLLKFTDRFFGMMTSSNMMISWVRNNIIPLLLKFFFKKNFIKKTMFRTLSQIQWSYEDCSLSKNISAQKLKFKAGDRLPYILINTGQEKESIYKKLTAPAFHLLMIGDATAVINESEFVKAISLGMEEWKPVGVMKPLYILVRPDNYIGLVADEMDNETLRKYLHEHYYFTG
ncbi:MAG TPA: FAD-dependent monooxygenase [Ferruginibacter sp.]|nr:FAD-dependent monooxygenase [Ferruginibacter sp.]